MQESSYLNKLIAIIDDLYLLQAGPFGSIICEEALEKWKAEERLLHHMHLPVYLEELLKELPDYALKKAFVNELKKQEKIYSHSAVRAFLDSF